MENIEVFIIRQKSSEDVLKFTQITISQLKGTFSERFRFLVIGKLLWILGYEA